MVEKAWPATEDPPDSGNDIIDAAVYVVDMFDQANTQKAVEELGSRGVLLKEAIEELRSALNKEKKRTSLDSNQANESW